VGPRWVGGVTARAGLSLLGLLLIVPAAPHEAADGTLASASSTIDEPWQVPVSWSGELATQLCAPNGIGSCTGIRQGRQDDLHIVPTARSPLAADLTIEWDATSSGVRELTVALDGMTSRQDCDGCTSYRFRVLGKAQGTSPLHLVVPEMGLRDGEEVAILVRVPDDLPDPIAAQAWTAQPFSVHGWLSGD
jgi:hypothetical protein